jgi:hypothetical protein
MISARKKLEDSPAELQLMMIEPTTPSAKLEMRTRHDVPDLDKRHGEGYCSIERTNSARPDGYLRTDHMIGERTISYVKSRHDFDETEVYNEEGDDSEDKKIKESEKKASRIGETEAERAQRLQRLGDQRRP